MDRITLDLIESSVNNNWVRVVSIGDRLNRIVTTLSGEPDRDDGKRPEPAPHPSPFHRIGNSLNAEAYYINGITNLVEQLENLLGLSQTKLEPADRPYEYAKEQMTDAAAMAPTRSRY